MEEPGAELLNALNVWMFNVDCHLFVDRSGADAFVECAASFLAATERLEIYRLVGN
jgi:hypothetical protein